MRFAVIILAVIVATLAINRFVFPTKPNTQYVFKTDTIKGDTVFNYIPVNVPVYRYANVGDTLWRTQPIDTAAILQRFFASYMYSDTITDTSFVAIISETISQNNITSRTFQVKNTRPIAIITTVTAKQYTWYLGASVTYANSVGVGLQAAYRFKYGFVTSTIDPINKTSSIGFLMPLN